MSKTYINTELRQQVRERANNCCEYCLLNEAFAFLAHEVDHIISEKHRGTTTEDNLCLSCFECNRFKGSDVGSIDIDEEVFIRLYNPRKDKWDEHFRLEEAEIIAKTAIGRVTVFLLNLNSSDQITKREELINRGNYPCIVRT